MAHTTDVNTNDACMLVYSLAYQLSGRAHELYSSTYIGSLNTKSCYEDVDDNNDEHQGSSSVLQDIQFEVHTLVIQVPLHDEDEQDAHQDLQDEGDADEGDEGDVEDEV